MSLSSILSNITNIFYQEVNSSTEPDGFIIREEDIISNDTKRKFRNLAREVSGENFDAPQDSRILFGCIKHPKGLKKPLLVAELAFQTANIKLSEPGVTFDSNFFHQLEFIFVLGDYQGCGYGTALVEKAIEICRWHDWSRAIRVQAAKNAVKFFEKQGFKTIGECINCLHYGSKLFRTLYNMQKQLD